MKFLGNVLTAMITPFKESGEVDYKGAADLALYLLENGSDGLIVAGTTGEGAAMSFEEKVKLFETIVQAIDGKAPIIANTGSNSTLDSIALTKAASEVGVDGCMAVMPYYNKPTQEGAYQHFSAIAQSTILPIVVYNVPGRTSSNLLPETLLRLAENHENIVAVKEASGNITQVSNIIRLLPKEFMVYSGDDALLLPILSVGGCGVISVVSHVVGKELNELVSAYKSRNTQRAKEIHIHLLPIMEKMFFISNPIPIKEAMRLLGKSSGRFRLPLVNASESEMKEIEDILKYYSLL